MVRKEYPSTDTGLRTMPALRVPHIAKTKDSPWEKAEKKKKGVETLVAAPPPQEGYRLNR